MTPASLARRTVPRDKILEYLLNPEHPLGSPKARFFFARGFSIEEWQRLAAALNGHPARNPVEETIATAFGTKYVVRCKVETPDGRNPCIVTVWMQEQAEPARLVTAYPAEAGS